MLLSWPPRVALAGPCDEARITRPRRRSSPRSWDNNPVLVETLVLLEALNSRLGRCTEDARTAAEIDIGEKWIVYRVGRRIRLIGPGGASRPFIHTSRTLSTPIGLSIEGRRVAWATNGVGSHRIRALLAPR